MFPAPFVRYYDDALHAAQNGGCLHGTAAAAVGPSLGAHSSRRESSTGTRHPSFVHFPMRDCSVPWSDTAAYAQRLRGCARCACLVSRLCCCRLFARCSFLAITPTPDYTRRAHTKSKPPGLACAAQLRPARRARSAHAAGRRRALRALLVWPRTRGAHRRSAPRPPPAGAPARRGPAHHTGRVRQPHGRRARPSARPALAADGRASRVAGGLRFGATPSPAAGGH